ncbi:MAG: three-Cys-motif partner protein TcmP [Planctomycetes bacterium]|nr:three-Cys-motif partner protein TcmP [Planctomycetota bacterium]
METENLYDGREQTLAKHYILRRYLLRLALIVGKWRRTINYVDCFSGPWNVRGEEYEDSSFAIAVHELLSAKKKLAESSSPPNIRCFFLEENVEAFAKLHEYSKTVQGVAVEARNNRLEDAIEDIIRFCAQGQKAFSFVFIDPTGWKGFPLKTIRPLLQLSPGEVLINFMTSHARRFITLDQEKENFDALYGDPEWRTELSPLSGDERDDAMVRLYAQRIRAAGGFQFVNYTPIFHRAEDRTHFHLIYVSRHQKGVEVFKDVERGAVEVMEKMRAQVKHKKLISGGQALLFGAEEMHDSSYYSRLRTYYLTRAKNELCLLLQRCQPLEYDQSWELAVSYPLVWEMDLREWITRWRQEGRVEVCMPPGTKVLKRGTGALLRWK